MASVTLALAMGDGSLTSTLENELSGSMTLFELHLVGLDTSAFFLLLKRSAPEPLLARFLL